MSSSTPTELPTRLSSADGIHNFPGRNGPLGGSDVLRGVLNGQLVSRNSFKNESITNFDLRLSKFFTFGDRYQADVYIQAFNLFDENSFRVG